MRIKETISKRTNAQTGQASVYVPSPSRLRFVFSREYNDGEYCAIQSAQPGIIEGEVENGDIVVIIIPIRGQQRWNVKYKEVLKMLARLTIDYSYLKSANLLK